MKFEIWQWFQRRHHHKQGFGSLEKKTTKWFGNTKQGIERELKIDTNNYIGFWIKLKVVRIEKQHT
jgi:hypothetical protein